MNILVSTGTGTLTDNITITAAVTAYDSVDFSGPSFAATAFNMNDGLAADTSGGQIYAYYVPAGGYAANGNLVASSDSVMGDWVYGYDTLNRLTSAVNALSTTVGAQYANQIGCWAYDAFGNRTAQYYQTAPCPTPESSVPVPTTNQVTYNSSNQVTGVNQSGPPNHLSGSFTYDVAGNVLNDTTNQYLYDAEGRLCAVESLTLHTMTQYLYDASGARVAKGTISPWPTSCTTATGFTPTALYLLGQGGGAVTELNGTGVWQHSNVSAGGVLANYASTTSAVYFQFTDPLGTRRIMADATGAVKQTCLSLPYGDGESCPTTPTEQLFTGKERDSESGNDYFGARYYASSMGRFMSPDWSAQEEPVPYAKLDDPQSLNLYSYVRNNPLSRVDADGHVDWGIQRAWNWLQGKGFKTDAQLQDLTVAQTAHSNKGSFSWATGPGGTSGRQLFKPGSNKCNEYVGDTLDQSGHKAPMVPDGKGGMRLATAHELADPNVHIAGLSDTKPMSQAQVGDVISQAHGDTEGHTGIIVAPGLTSSANANEGGVITENNWGFRDPNAAVNNGERNGSNSPPPVVRTPIDQP